MIIRSRERERERERENRGRELFEKSSLPRTPSRKNFDWWGGRAKGVRSCGKLKHGERFLERLFQQATPPE
ncbi:hypothetical protein WCP94_001821 [Bilophila wadsworthia]